MLITTLFLPLAVFTVRVTCLPHQVMPNKCSRMDCINTVEDLITNFHCDRQTNSTDVAFHFLPLWKYLFHKERTILAVYYRISHKDRTQTSKTERYTSSEGSCSPSDTNNCRVYVIYSNPLFYVVLPRLLFSISFFRYPPRYHEYATQAVLNYYWKPLPFCNYEHIDSILQDFSERVR